MPDQDPYADAAPTEAAAPEAPEKDTTAEQEQPGDSQTAEVPKTVLGGGDHKPGDKCEFEVVKVMGDSVLLKYSHPDEEEGEEKETPPPAAAHAQGGGNPLYQ